MFGRVTRSVGFAVALVGLGCSEHDAARSRDGGADSSRTPSEGGLAHEGGAPSSDAAPDHTTTPYTSEAGVAPLLSETGLFADVSTGALAPGVRAYEPQGVLWADGAAKKRWVFLPPDSRIDTSSMDYWVYPVGTKLWKEFTVGQQRIETRLIEKVSSSAWNLIAYEWKADQTDAVAVPDGVVNASGTAHDIPSSGDCQRCHGGLPDDVLGFTAVQLSHSGGGVTMNTLITEQRLTNPPSAPFALPGDATAQAALLYLHANCGQCHNPRGFVTQQTGYGFWLNVATLASVEHTEAYQTAVMDLRDKGVGASMILERMKHRGNGQMPPLATKDVDAVGVATVEAWLQSLASAAPSVDAGTDGGTADAALDH